jgi:predicted RNA-binding protein with PUA-like domain
MAKRYWLMKSEEDVYSIHDLEKDGTTHWEGVRNYEARNLMRDEMKVGDGVLFYHSNADPPGVAGLATVVKAGYPDHIAFDKKSRYHDPRIRAAPELQEMALLKRPRLSVQPVSKTEFHVIRKMGRRKASR